jgi:uncharacterized protein (DUF4213/DUF364 family)
MITNDLMQRALELGGDKRILDVRAGLGYTGVLLEGNSCGLAYTFRMEMGDGCGILDDAGRLIGRKAGDVIPWLADRDRLRAALGLATINGILNDGKRTWDSGNVLDAFSLEKSETFGMVGAFPPILMKVKAMTDHIYVFEQNVPPGSEYYDSSTIPMYLPKCDVVVLTATSIINHTFDEVTSHLHSAREVCLVGPSTPLCPEILKKYNITLLAGSVVTNPEMALQVISQGGGTMALKPATKQVLVRS